MENNLADKILGLGSDCATLLLDMDEQTRTYAAAAFGFFITLYSLHKIEQKLRELFLTLFTHKFILLSLILILLAILVYFVIKLGLFRKLFDYINKRPLFRYLALGLFSLISLYVMRNQYLNFRNRHKFGIVSKDSNTPQEIVIESPLSGIKLSALENFDYDAFNQDFLNIISNIYRKHIKSESFKDKFLEIVKEKADTSKEVLKDSVILYDYLKNALPLENKNESMDNSKQDNIKFKNLLELWKFLMKVCVSSIVILVLIYFLMRAMLWFVLDSCANTENSVVRYNENLNVKSVQLRVNKPVDLENSSSKKRHSYIKHNLSKTSSNRISLKSRNKRLSKYSNSVDALNYMDANEPIDIEEMKLFSNLNNYNEEMSVDSTDLPVEESVAPEHLDVSIASSTTTIAEPNLSQTDSANQNFNIEFFIHWLTTLNEEHELDKQIDINLADVFNKISSENVNF